MGGPAVGRGVLVTEGPVERIRREVHRVMWTLGRGGGYLPAIDHSMPMLRVTDANGKRDVSPPAIYR